MAIVNTDAPPSKRELEVLSLMYVGYTHKEAAIHLNISVRTVNFHMESLYQKLDVHNKVEAFRKMGWMK